MTDAANRSNPDRGHFLPAAAAFHRLPAESFPVVIEALPPHGDSVLWSATVELPGAADAALVEIPALAERFGFRVRIRLRFGDGTSREALA